MILTNWSSKLLLPIRLFTLCTMLLVCFSPIGAAQSAPSSEMIPFINGAALDLLYGYDTTLQTGSAPCVTSSGPITDPDTKYATTSATLHYIHDATTYVQTHQTSAAAAYNYGIYSASGDVQYLKQYSLNTYSEFAELTSEIEYSRVLHVFDDLKLTKEAIEAYRAGGAAQFRNLCGDKFVLGKVLGAEFRAILRASSMNSEEQESTRTKLSGGNGVLSGSISDYSYFQTLQNQKKLDTELLRIGPLSALPGSDFDSLYKYAIQFPVEVGKLESKPTKGWVVSSYYALLTKAELANLPPSPQEAALETGFQYLRTLMVSRANMTYIDNHSEQFGIHNKNKLAVRIAEMDAEISKVQAWGRKCLSGVLSKTPCDALVQIPVPRIPERSYPYFNKTDPHPLASTPADEMIPNPRDLGDALQLVPQKPWRFPGEKRVFQLIGRWYNHHPTSIVGFEVNYCIRPKGNTSCPLQVNDGQPVLVPYQSDVFISIKDIAHKDNDQFWPDPLRARITDQLYPGDME